VFPHKGAGDTKEIAGDNHTVRGIGREGDLEKILLRDGLRRGFQGVQGVQDVLEGLRVLGEAVIMKLPPALGGRIKLCQILGGGKETQGDKMAKTL